MHLHTQEMQSAIMKNLERMNFQKAISIVQRFNLIQLLIQKSIYIDQY